MKKGGTLVLKAFIVLIGLGVLVLCIFALPTAWYGVTVEFPEYPLVGFSLRLILLGMYLTTIPFYFGLHQGFKLLVLIDKNAAFSEQSVKTLRNIKLSAASVGVIYLLCVPFLFPFAEVDDAPGLLLFGLAAALMPVIVSVFAAVLEKLLKNALEIKSENDLTV